MDVKVKSVATATVSVVLALGLTACGENGSKSNDNGTNAASSGDELVLKYAQCLRRNGLDVSGPVNGEVKINGEPERSKFQAAQDACRQYSPQKDNHKLTSKEMDRMMMRAKCLRQHGVEAKDPTNTEGIRIINNGMPNDKIVAANKTCDGEVPVPSAKPNP